MVDKRALVKNFKIILGVAFFFALGFYLVSVFAATTIIGVEKPVDYANFSTTIPFINVTTSDISNCTYSIINDTVQIGPTLLGNGAISHEVADVNISSLVDGQYNISVFCMNSSNATDNDTLATKVFNKDATAPVITAPANATLEYKSASLDVIFSASDSSSLDAWTVSDTTNFSINSTGGLTNATVLGVGIYVFNIGVNDTSGNSDSVIYQVNVSDTTAPVLTSIDNQTVYSNSSLNINIIASDASTIGYSVNHNNFSIDFTGLMTNNTMLIDGTYLLTINISDTSGNTANDTFILTVLSPTSILATASTTTVENGTTTVVFNTLSENVIKVVISSNVSGTTSVTLDLAALLALNGDNVTMVNDLNLSRETGTANYSVSIDSGTVITGNATWDGVLQMPTVNTSTFSPPSFSGYDTAVQVVIDMGSTGELNFSSPIKIVVTGMAGSNAAWARGSSTLNDIALQCINETDSSVLNNSDSTKRECYVDSADGNDLVIWTYHFTSFSAYSKTVTPEVISSSPSSGGCLTDWECSEWSVCSDGEQTRTCEKEISYCYAPAKDKPAESQSCTVSETTEPSAITKTPAEEVVEKVKKMPVSVFTWTVVGIILAGLIIAYLVMRKQPVYHHVRHK